MTVLPLFIDNISCLLRSGAYSCRCRLRAAAATAGTKGGSPYKRRTAGGVQSSPGYAPSTMDGIPAYRSVPCALLPSLASTDHQTCLKEPVRYPLRADCTVTTVAAFACPCRPGTSAGPQWAWQPGRPDSPRRGASAPGLRPILLMVIDPASHRRCSVAAFAAAQVTFAACSETHG